MFESHTSNTRAATNLSKTSEKCTSQFLRAQSDIFKLLIFLQPTVQNSNINIISSFIFFIKKGKKSRKSLHRRGWNKKVLAKKNKRNDWSNYSITRIVPLVHYSHYSLL